MGYYQGRFDVGIPSKGYLMSVHKRRLRRGRELKRDVQFGFEAIDDNVEVYKTYDHLESFRFRFGFCFYFKVGDGEEIRRSWNGKLFW